jgi:hypothetical protein
VVIIMYDCYNELYHYGIKGMKWGVRRYQKKDGTLTPAGKKRLLTKGFDSTQDWSNRKAVNDKVMKEVDSTKEGREWNDLVKRRGIKQSNGKVTLSYMKDDWSNPEKVMDEMIKDMGIEQAYQKKEGEIAKKYTEEYAGAMLRDFGLRDTEAGRKYVNKHILGN